MTRHSSIPEIWSKELIRHYSAAHLLNDLLDAKDDNSSLKAVHNVCQLEFAIAKIVAIAKDTAS